jgi:hypothetical protein
MTVKLSDIGSESKEETLSINFGMYGMPRVGNKRILPTIATRKLEQFLAGINARLTMIFIVLRTKFLSAERCCIALRIILKMNSGMCIHNKSMKI